MKRPNAAALSTLFVLLAFFVRSDAWAFKRETHEHVNGRAADVSSIDGYLKQQLGLTGGLREDFGGKTVRQRLAQGGAAEDLFEGSETLGALNRSLHHFQNPLLPWASAGLRARCFVIFSLTGQASVRWAQALEEQAGGSARWADARQRLLEMLTLSTKQERDDAGTKLFTILGQQMHLISDLAVPAHTRNDVHCTRTAEGFEVWAVQDTVLDQIDTLMPTKPDTAIFRLGLPAEEGVARVPVARLWDADLYTGTNPDVTITSSVIGLSEYANANFFSGNTIFSTKFAFPARTSVALKDTPEIAPGTGGQQRRYFTKVRDGELIDHMAVPSALYFKDALRRGDIDTALGSVVEIDRDDYRQMLTGLTVPLSQIDAVLTDISFVSLQGDHAEYQMIRVDDGVLLSQLVLFELGDDGIWRLKFF